LIFWMTMVIPLYPVGQELCMQVLVFPVAWTPPRASQATAAVRQHLALHRLVLRRPPRRTPQLLPMAPPPPSRLVLLPLQTPHPRSLPVALVASPAAPSPRRPRQSFPSLMRTTCARVARTGFAILSTA
jgi:hypothetical protein